MRHVMILGVLTLSATACTDIGSGSLLTSGMSAVISGEADGTGDTEVTVVLRAGGIVSNTYVELEGDDELTVTSGAESATLSQRSLGAVHSYAATLPVDAEDSEFTVSLSRTVDEGAPASTFELPAPIGDMDGSAVFEPNADYTLSWTAAADGDEMEVVATGECIVAYARELTGDPGSLVIPHDDITPLGDEPGLACDVDIELRRVRGGQVDPGFGEGGLVQGAQVVKTTTAYNSGQ